MMETGMKELQDKAFCELFLSSTVVKSFVWYQYLFERGETSSSRILVGNSHWEWQFTIKRPTIEENWYYNSWKGNKFWWCGEWSLQVFGLHGVNNPPQNKAWGLWICNRVIVLSVHVCNIAFFTDFICYNDKSEMPNSYSKIVVILVGFQSHEVLLFEGQWSKVVYAFDYIFF
jgi:hypothetical protein